MSHTDEFASSMKDKEMSTSKNSSSLRLNQEGGGSGSGGVGGIVDRSECWQDHDTDSEISENDFLTKGAFLLTPSHELSMEKAATICEKMNFSSYVEERKQPAFGISETPEETNLELIGGFSSTFKGLIKKTDDLKQAQLNTLERFSAQMRNRLDGLLPIQGSHKELGGLRTSSFEQLRTFFSDALVRTYRDECGTDWRIYSKFKTSTGILFKFSNIEDFQAVYKKGFHKVTGARFYKKIAIPCRPAKTFTVYVLDVPEELPEDDVRHALYKYRSIVEVTRLPLNTGTVLKAVNDKLKTESQNSNEPATIYTGPPIIRVTLASVEETSMLLSRGLDFYGATYFPTETPHPSAQNLSKYKNNRWAELASLGAGQRVRDLLPVFDNAGFTKLPPPASRVIKPQRN